MRSWNYGEVFSMQQFLAVLDELQADFCANYGAGCYIVKSF